MIFEILNDNNEVINTISADISFVTEHFPGRFREVFNDEPEAEEDSRVWWIDIGPFYDRFGADALAITASDNGACKAVQTLTGVRKYIDLKDPKVAQMIDMLIALNQPEAQPWAPGSGPMTTAKKTAILNTPTTEKERHIKGL